jgi:hypothetical protein
MPPKPKPSATAKVHKSTIVFSAVFHDRVSRYLEERSLTLADLVKQAVAIDMFFWENRECEVILRSEHYEQEVVLPFRTEAGPAKSKPKHLSVVNDTADADGGSAA